MGRSIPSFRILLEIEKLGWKQFRKHLSKEDKKIFDRVFSIPKLYCHCLSHLSKPLIIEPIIFSIIFYNFKRLITILESLHASSKTSKNNNIKQKSFETCIDKQHQNTLKNKIEGAEKETKKDSSNNIIDEWSKFIDCLNEEDKNAFISMIKSCYNQYHDCIEANTFKGNSDTCLNRTVSLFMALILYQQKQIDLIKFNQSFF